MKNRLLKGHQKAQNSPWSLLPSRATPQSLWTAKKLALGKSPPRFPNIPNADIPAKINSALLDHFFPSSPSSPLPTILRPHLNCPPLLPSEITTVLRKCSPSSAPGPDSIPYSVWKVVHLTAPRLLTDLLNPPLRFGYHLASLKRANGVVLDKPGKPSYDSPASFHIIV